MVIVIILVVLAALYLLALMCRRGHEKLPELRKWYYAHRGLHGSGVPENSMAAFRLALEKGYGIELDIHLLRDGALAVIHDSLLRRTTGADGCVEDLTAGELKNYRLENTDEPIPTLEEVLDLFSGKAPMIIELKPERGNHAALTEKVCRVLEHYSGLYCIESFDPRCIRWLRKHRPEIVRGQLAENLLRDKTTNISPILRFSVNGLQANFLTRPDFIAYKFEDRKDFSCTLCRWFWHPQQASWTIRNQEDLNIAVREGSIPIFERFEP